MIVTLSACEGGGGWRLQRPAEQVALSSHRAQTPLLLAASPGGAVLEEPGSQGLRAGRAPSAPPLASSPLRSLGGGGWGEAGVSTDSPAPSPLAQGGAWLIDSSGLRAPPRPPPKLDLWFLRPSRLKRGVGGGPAAPQGMGLAALASQAALR